MFDPERNHAIYEAITETKTFKIDPIDYKSKEKIQFYSKKALYRIIIIALTETEFYLKLDHEAPTERIFEGYPVTINLSIDNTTIIQFVNGQQLDQPVTLMANIDEMDTSSGLPPTVNIDVIVQLDTG